MKIGVYGTGVVSEECIRFWNNYQQVEIVFFTQTVCKEKKYNNYVVIDKSEIDWNVIDYLVITSDIYYNEIVKELKILLDSDYDKYSKKIIHYDEFNAALLILNKKTPFLSCEVENGLFYISHSEDKVIPGKMRLKSENWAKDTMDAYLSLVKRYYPEKSEMKGYFFDIGANIGTTSIYMKKNNPMLKVIGFELAKENYDLLRVNCILNNMEDINTENIGLADKIGELSYSYCPFNSGGSGIDINKKTKAHIDTLDNYVTSKRISSCDIDMLWVDVEGYECKVVIGAENTLLKEKIPIIQEMTFDAYKDDDFSYYYKIMKDVYSFFIDMSEYLSGHTILRPIDSLDEYRRNMIEIDIVQTDIFFG